MYSKYKEGPVGEVIYPFFYFYSQFHAGVSKVGLSVLTFVSSRTSYFMMIVCQPSQTIPK